MSNDDPRKDDGEDIPDPPRPRHAPSIIEPYEPQKIDDDDIPNPRTHDIPLPARDDNRRRSSHLERLRSRGIVETRIAQNRCAVLP